LNNRLISLGLFLFAVYLLTYTPRINSSDGLAMFATAENLLRRGAVDVEQIRWMGLQQGTYGLDGLLYSRKGMGVPLAMLPLTWLGLIVPIFGPVTTSLLFNAFVTTLTAMLLAHYLTRLGYSEAVGLLVALTFGLCTLAWPYAKSLFSDPFSGLLLLTTAYCLFQYRVSINNVEESQSKLWVNKASVVTLVQKPLVINSWLFLAGLALAWNIATRYAEAIFVPIFALYLLQTRPHRFSKPVRSFVDLTIFGLPVGLILLAIAYFNFSRYGDPFNTGYLPNETFSGLWLQGIMGQLISPGRGLLLYSPILGLAFIGAWLFYPRHRAETLLASSIILLHLLLYGKWFMWHGGYAWGPRFLIPTLPFWCILLAPMAEKAVVTRSPQFFAGYPQKIADSWAKWLYLALATLSFIPQLLSVTIDFAPFQDSLMNGGLPLFDPATFFEWQYSPFVAAWSFIQQNSLDVAWAWQGHLAWGLFGLLCCNIALTGINLGYTFSKSEAEYLRSTSLNPRYLLLFVTILTNLISTIVLLGHAHTLPSQPLQQAVNSVNKTSQPNEAIILNNPDLTLPFAELYKGQAIVLGLNNGGFPLPQDIEQRLKQVMADHEQIVWLPNALLPQESAIEQTLLANGVLLRSENFDGQRVSWWAMPRHLMQQPLLPETRFGEGIELRQISYSSQAQAGHGLVIELQWQTQQIITENYHVFIHLVNQVGEVVAQADGQPVHWTRPTTSWAVGKKVTDHYGLWLPVDMPTGVYQLRVGWYQPSNGQRLLLPSGADALEFIVKVGD